MGVFEFWNVWIWFASAAFGIMITLVGSVYVLSQLLVNEKMKGWAKMELVEIFYSAVILSLAFAGLPLIDAVVQGSLGVSNSGLSGPDSGGSITSAWIPTSDSAHLFGQKQYEYLDICGSAIASNERSVYHDIESCHMRLGIWYMREIFNEGKDFAFDIYLDYIQTSMISEFTINVEFIFEKAGFFTFTPWKGFYTVGNKVKELTFDWAIKILMLSKFQEVLLRFIAVALFPSLFVIGIVLRTFTFTRRLGGLLLAMAIALYFVFPAFYSLGALIMLDIKNDPIVINDWIHNGDANPGGKKNPSPPIANMMYLKGELLMPGGSGKQNFEDIRDMLQKYEGMSSEEYFNQLEAGGNNPNEKLLPQFDLTSNQYASASDDEKLAALANARSVTDNWFGSVSEQNKIDKFVSFAWEKNGPIDTLSRLTFWSVFFSLFSIIATIAAIRSLSMTFGGDIEIAGLTRLI